MQMHLKNSHLNPVYFKFKAKYIIIIYNPPLIGYAVIQWTKPFSCGSCWNHKFSQISSEYIQN